MVFKIKIETGPAGGHDRLNVFAGPDLGHLANVGTLTMLAAEQEAFVDTVFRHLPTPHRVRLEWVREDESEDMTGGGAIARVFLLFETAELVDEDGEVCEDRTPIAAFLTRHSAEAAETKARADWQPGEDHGYAVGDVPLRP